MCILSIDMLHNPALKLIAIMDQEFADQMLKACISLKEEVCELLGRLDVKKQELMWLGVADKEVVYFNVLPLLENLDDRLFEKCSGYNKR